MPRSDALLQLVWTQAWQVAVLAVAVAVVVRWTCRRRPHLAYLLWMLVVVKAVTPPVWSSPTSVFSRALAETVVTSSGSERVLPPTMPASQVAPLATSPDSGPLPSTVERPKTKPSEPAIPSLSPSMVLLSAWALGAMSLGGWLIAGWLSLVWRLRAVASPAPCSLQARFDELQSQLGPRRPVRLLVTDETLGPAAMGWWRGTVIVPHTLVDNSEPGNLDAILTHELVHLRRFDPLLGSLQLAVQCLWCWHPAVWWANRQARIERERSCDEAVLAELDCRPVDYARLLVEILQWRQRMVPAVFWSGMSSSAATTARVRHVLEAKAFRRRSPWAAWVVAGIALAIVIPGAGNRFIAAAMPPEQSKSTPPPTVANNDQLSSAIADWKENRTFGTLTADEQATVLELEELGIECSLGDYGPASTSYLTSGPGQLHFDPPSVPAGTLKTYIAITLPRDLVPKTPLPLDRLSSLLSVRVGYYNFEMAMLGLPTEDLLRAQLKSLVNMPSSATLNILYSRTNAEALRVLPMLPHLERLALWPDFVSVPSDKYQFRLDALRLHALCWSSEAMTPTDFDNRLPDIAKITTLEQLILTGKMRANALNQLSSLRRLRTLHVTRHWVMGEQLPPLQLNCLGQMPDMEDLGVDLMDDTAAMFVGRLSKLRKFWAIPAFGTDAGLKELAKPRQLRSLHLSGGGNPTRITSKGLAALSSLTNLRSLQLTGWNTDYEHGLQVTDESLAGWHDLTELEELKIDTAAISDIGLGVLGHLKQLRTIQLQGKLQVTDEGLAPLAGLSQLQMLILPENLITGPGLVALTGLSQLKTLSLARGQLQDSGMTELAKMSSLRQLDISGTNITGNGLRAFDGKLPQLTRLNLANTDVDDEGAAALLNRARLQELDVTNTKLSLRFLHELTEHSGLLRVWSDARGEARGNEFQPVEWRHPVMAMDDLTAVAAVAPDAQPEEPPAATNEDALIARLNKLGLRVTAFDVGGQTKLYADFDKGFQPLDEPLPLEDLPKLETIVIGDRRNLNEEQIIARLRAVRNVRPETMLIVFFKPDQGAAFDLLAEMPNLQRLTLLSDLPTLGGDTGRKVSLAQFKKLRELGLIGNFTDESLAELTPLDRLETLQLNQMQPFARLDLTCLENKPRLRRLITGGIEPTDEAFARIGKLQNLEYLATSFTSATDDGMSQLAKLTKLKTLTLDTSKGPIRVTPEGLQAIGKLPNLASLSVFALPSPGEVTAKGILDDRVIAGWSQLATLKSLHLFNCELTDASLITISKLPSLVRLNLAGKLQIDDQSLAALGTMANLKHLTLPGTAITDERMANLGPLNNLESLALYDAPQVTDAGLAPLGTFATLKELTITNGKIEGRGLAPITTLTSLSLENNPVDDAGIEIIVRNKQLTNLNLSDTKITDRALKLIGQSLPELRRLQILHTQVTDAGAAELKPLADLREVNASGSQVTESAARASKGVLQINNDWATNGRVEFFSLDVD